MKDKQTQSAINIVFVFFVAGAILFAAIKQSGGSLGDTTALDAVGKASGDAASAAVNLSISLIGFMALWLGLVRILEAGGLLHSLAKVVRPLMVRLFPDVPADHPAMSSMILNISANMLGLGNAATPLGIKAMVQLNQLNPLPGTATNAMCLFLALNTSSVALLPLGVIGIRTAAGASAPESIFLPTLLATTASTVVGIITAVFLARIDRKYPEEVAIATYNKKNSENNSGQASDSEETETKDLTEPAEEDLSHLILPAGPFSRMIGLGMPLLFFALFFYQMIQSQQVTGVLSFVSFLKPYLMPGLMLLIIAFGVSRGVKIYEAVTEGAKQGFEIAVRIIPFLVAILVAIAMFRASGAMDILLSIFSPITDPIGMPADVLPMALVRPLSGSGAFGIMSALVNESPDSYSSFVASTLQGSTETTFYVLAVYFGSVGVTRVRHALLAGLIADAAGVVATCIVCRLFWS